MTAIGQRKVITLLLWPVFVIAFVIAWFAFSSNIQSSFESITGKPYNIEDDSPQNSGFHSQSNHPESRRSTLEIEAVLRRLSRISTSLERLWCTTQNVMSNGGFCVRADRVFTGGNNMYNTKMCLFIEDMVGNNSIADFGAGLGLYGMCFLRNNGSHFNLAPDQKQKFMDNIKPALNEVKEKPQVVYSWHGFDGAFSIDEVSGGFIKYTDLSEEGLWLGRKWDWVMSVEVGEHIDPKYEAYFLDNIVRHACQGIVMTWAVEGQGGHHHVNNHNNDYIKKKMHDRGLISDEQNEQTLRSLFSNYFHDTSMVFRFTEPTSCLTGY